MSSLVRKQIYINHEQEALLKHLSRQTGDSEAELIRQAIDMQMKAVSPRRDFRAWQTEREFIHRLLAQPIVVGRRSWTREELHDR